MEPDGFRNVAPILPLFSEYARNVRQGVSDWVDKHGGRSGGLAAERAIRHLDNNAMPWSKRKKRVHPERSQEQPGVSQINCLSKCYLVMNPAFTQAA